MNFAEGWLTAFVWDIGSMAGQSLGPGCAKRDMGKPMKYSTDGLKKKQIRTLGNLFNQFINKQSSRFHKNINTIWSFKPFGNAGQKLCFCKL